MNMKLKLIICIAVFSLLSNISLYAQVDTRGTEFWLTFGKNAGDSAINVGLQIRIVSGSQMTVTGTIRFTDLTGSIATVSFSVPTGQVYTYELNSIQRKAVYNETTGIGNQSVHITTSAPVSVYALNQLKNSTDATNVLPVSALGTNYYQISYTPEAFQDAYAIVATQDGTLIYHNGATVATLNRGQVYYRTSASDMTGAHITADKPVALFAMNQSAYVPAFAAADNFFQQLAPVNTWGKTFFAPVNHLGTEVIRIVASQNNTRIVQVGANRVTGSLTLNAGQFCELEVPLSSGGCYIQADKPVGVCTYLTGMLYNSPPAFGDPSQAWLPPISQTIKTALMAPFIPNGVTEINKHYALIVTPTATREATRVRTGGGTEQPLSGGTWVESMAAEMSFYAVELTEPRSTYFYTNNAGLFLMAYGIGNTESYYYMASSSMRDLDVAFYVNDVHHQDLAFEIICKKPAQFRAAIEYPMSDIAGFIKWYIDDEEEIAARDQITWSKDLPNGSYHIRMVAVLDDDNMTARTVEAILTIGKSELNLENLIFCSGETARRISFTGINVTPAVCTWEVTEGSGTAIGMSANSGTGPIPAFLAINDNDKDTTITITVIPRSAEGCEGEPATFTITVFLSGPTEINLGNDTTICWIDSLLLNGEHPRATHYQWKDGSTKTTYTVYQQGGDYWLTVSNPCNKASDTINITYLSDLTVNLGNDTVFCEGAVNLQLNATTPGAISYEWEDGSKSPVYLVEEEGIYIVTVSNACMSVTDTIEVKIENCRVELEIPNVFTPNGDGVNDTFGPEFTPVENVKEFQMFIYNRWGRLVFSTTNPQKPWDGNNEQGRPYAEGIYYCVLHYTDRLDKEHRYHSTLTLIR